MKCPSCGHPDTKVIDTRVVSDGCNIRRKRECLACQRRFITFEAVDTAQIVVIKRDGSRELFDRDKLRNGLIKACFKRPINVCLLYTSRCDSEEIGTITTPPPVGDRFALAGRVWEVEELDISRKLVYVKSIDGKMEVSWPGDYGEIHTKILKRMRKVLQEDTVYPYLLPNAAHRLDVAKMCIRDRL